jgi:uncharacterized metal-binding protein YceD (DUF177 family)
LYIQAGDLPLQPEFQKAVAMNAFVAYSIPVQGLKTGIHHFRYTVDSAFFSCFEESPVGNAEVGFELVFDKRPDMIVLDFSLKGHVEVECDRCTATINLPLEDERQLIVKYGEAEEGEDDEVLFLSREAFEINIARYLYEFTVLALPITNTYDCENDQKPPCNFEILKYLKTDENKDDSGSVWDALKGIGS